MRPDSTIDPLDDDENETPRFEDSLSDDAPDLDDDDGGDDDLDDLEDDDDLDDLDLDDDSRTVLITGACGNIGRKLRAAWEDEYDLILLDSKFDPDDPDVIAVDLSVFDESWITHFHGVDTVVHLAANPNAEGSLEDLTGPNLDALANVFNAAALAGVDRIIFASSNHVAAGRRGEGVELITAADPPRPSGVYGELKYVGERLGKSLAMAFDLTFIALRLGFVQPGPNRPETLLDDWDKKLWLSNGDLVRLFDAAVEAEIEDRLFLVANGVSRNQGTPWDLTLSAEILGYLPEDDAFADEGRIEAADEPA